MPKPHTEVLVPTPPHSSTDVQWQLMCPACGSGNIENAGYGRDHEVVTVHPDRDE